MIALISSSVCLILWYASAGGSLSSRMSLSTLLTNTQIGRRSFAACLMSRSVPHITPSTASTTSITPSLKR